MTPFHIDIPQADLDHLRERAMERPDAMAADLAEFFAKVR